MSTSLEIRSVHLRVADLARSLTFYRDQLGFSVRSTAVGRAELDADPAATTPQSGADLVLTESPSAPTAPKDSAGLFHAALLLSSRGALGQWLRQAASAGVEFQGFSDHGVSEALYLTDPDGNGLEIYADRPQAEWPLEHGSLAMTTEPLRLPDLLAAGARHEGAALTGARWGHLHFRVTHLDRSEAFYSNLLQLRLTQRYGASARFLAADDYHHHFGLNTWGGVRQTHPTDALGLVDVTVASQQVAVAETVHDPDGITLKLVPLTGSF